MGVVLGAAACHSSSLHLVDTPFLFAAAVCGGVAPDETVLLGNSRGRRTASLRSWTQSRIYVSSSQPAPASSSTARECNAYALKCSKFSCGWSSSELAPINSNSPFSLFFLRRRDFSASLSFLGVPVTTGVFRAPFHGWGMVIFLDT